MDTMTISLSGIRLNSKNLKAIEQFLVEEEEEEKVSTDVPDLTPQPKKSKKTRSVEQSVENTPLPKTETEPESESEPTDETVSLEQIVNKTRELVQGNKSADVKKYLTKYGVNRVSDIPENKYNEFYNDINQL